MIRSRSQCGLFVVDSFTHRPFTGNPAAVCVLDSPREDAWHRAVAAEMNLSETAFVRRIDERVHELRWFTPTVEVSLCGHATLAAAFVLFETGAEEDDTVITFRTLSGDLQARRRGSQFELDFPARPCTPCAPPPAGSQAIGGLAADWFSTQPDGLGEYQILALLGDEEAVRSLEPDLSQLRAHGSPNLMVTAAAKGGDDDFVSRYFAPSMGIDEDPVTGSAHCILGPFWAERLERRELSGFQASRRGGRVGVRVEGTRVRLRGDVVMVSMGVLVA